MNETSSAIERYIREEIALNRDDISATAKSREWFLTRIGNEIASRASGMRLHPSTPFVPYGSYFKRTKVRDVDEFDVLVVIDSNGGIYGGSGGTIGSGLGSASPNPKYLGLYHKADASGVSPLKKREWLHDIVSAVVQTHGGEIPEKDGPAVTLKVAGQGFSMDLVPAGIFKHSNGTRFYNIPKGDAEDNWTVTSPETDILRLNTAATDRENFRNVIRLMKQVRDAYSVQVSSFAIETAVIDYSLNNPWTDDVHTDLCGALQDFADKLEQGFIPDPYLSTTNLLVGKEPDGARVYRFVLGVLKAVRVAPAMSIDGLYETIRETFEAKLS